MRACLLGLGLVAAACAAVPAPMIQAPTLPPPQVVQAPVTPAPSLAPPSSPAPEPEAPTTVTAPTPEPPHVLIEPPYSALGHARLATEMLTLGRDEELFQWALGG